MIKRALFYSLSLPLILYAIAFVAECGLALKGRPNADANKANPGFHTQYLHPYYYFSFPTKKNELQKINSKSSWVDERGYRGPGPQKKGKKKLAILLGASSAFGVGSSSNETTITGYLNQLQNEYFFVNAGVPSWNSFQELLRFLKQELKTQPDLVITLNGFNDLAIGATRTFTKLPADAPESFEDLDRWVSDIRSRDFRGLALLPLLEKKPVLRHLILTELRHRILGVSEHSPNQESSIEYLDEPKSDEIIAKEAASFYFENMRLIKELSDLHRIRFLAFFQPCLLLEEDFIKITNIPDGDWWREESLKKSYLIFRDKVKKKMPAYMMDFSEPFPGASQEILSKYYMPILFILPMMATSSWRN